MQERDRPKQHREKQESGVKQLVAARDLGREAERDLGFGDDRDGEKDEGRPVEGLPHSHFVAESPDRESREREREQAKGASGAEKWVSASVRNAAAASATAAVLAFAGGARLENIDVFMVRPRGY